MVEVGSGENKVVGRSLLCRTLRAVDHVVRYRRKYHLLVKIIEQSSYYSLKADPGFPCQRRRPRDRSCPAKNSFSFYSFPKFVSRENMGLMCNVPLA
jgi:hypothetical protein